MSNIVFGTDGWRALIADQFTYANVEKVAYAIGKYVQSTYCQNGKTVPVLVGYDTRFLADKFARRVAQVLTSMGLEARLSDRDVPTPVIAWNCRIEPTGGAIQLTASHNPPEWCGMKYIPDYAGPATNEITAAIVANLENAPVFNYLEGVPVKTFDPKPAYVAGVEQFVDMKLIGKSGLKVVVDCLYSTSRGYLDYLLSNAGLSVKSLHDWRDPLFGGLLPEPKAECLVELSHAVVAEKADVGLATDGDADRFAVIAEDGNYFSANMLLSMLTRHLVKNRGKKGVICRTVATTHLLNKLAEMYGLEVVETPVGFKYVGEVMRQMPVMIGGEESGGFSIEGHIPEKDGIMGNLFLMEMLAYEKKPLTQIWADLCKETGMDFAYRRRDLHLTPETHRGLIERLNSQPIEKIGSRKVESVSRRDGFKLYLQGSRAWVLVRPSGTEPLMRLYYEGENAAEVDALKQDFDKEIDSMIAGLEKKLAGACKS